MKLYSYDHCPFCVRARMIFGLHNIPFEHIILANDDETTPISLIGKKMLPILIKADGTAMGESLDIVRYIDAQAEYPLLKSPLRTEIQTWYEKVGSYYHRLTMPRTVKIGLEEFASDSAIDYFTQKKTSFIGDFAQNLANSEQYIQQIHTDLIALDRLLVSTDGMNGQIDEEDFWIFPVLRSLSMVKGIQFPERIMRYLQTMSDKTAVPLFLDRAI